MNPSCELSLVVPLYNEETCIGRSLPDLLQCLEKSGICYELLAVNDCSLDRTKEILDELAVQWPRLRVFHLPQNQGYGGAILTGLEAAQGMILGFTCGDGEVSPEDVISIYTILRTGAIDLVKAKRIRRQDGFMRQLFSFGYHLIVMLLFRAHVTDVNGYPVLMTREAYQRIAPTARDWMINVDILVGMRRHNLRTAELDVIHRKRLGGCSNVRLWYPFLFLWKIIRFRFHLDRWRVS